jgi:DNA-binding XRE family transcriptional regulator
MKDVQQIRSVYSGGDTSLAQLAKIYGVSRKTIWNVIHFEQWIPIRSK